MKIETNNVVNNQDIENLLNETHETLAFNLANDMLQGKVKNFSVVDLWKIQKTRRVLQNYRRYNNY